MELRQLGYFVAVAQDRNFTRAAARLHVAQSGISQQVRRLERELGEALFDRSGQSIQLTEAGVAFLPYARAALGATEEGRQALAELRGLVRGSLSLGVVQALPPEIDLPALLARYHRSYPRVEISLREGNTDSLVDDLKHGALHSAIVGLGAGEVPEAVTVEVISVEPLLLVTAPDHPLAGREQVSLESLRDEPFITAIRGAGLRQYLEASSAQLGFRFRVAFETSEVPLLTDLAAQGLGVTIVPRSVAVAGATRVELATVPIVRPRLQRTIALASRPQGPLPPAARAFLKLAREIFFERAG